MITVAPDTTPRYAPSHIVVCVNHTTYRTVPVLEHVIHAPGTAPSPCPIRKDLAVVELRTAHGSRWYGFDRAWINSELRCVVSGIDPRNEYLRMWPVCRIPQ